MLHKIVPSYNLILYLGISHGNWDRYNITLSGVSNITALYTYFQHMLVQYYEYTALQYWCYTTLSHDYNITLQDDSNMIVQCDNYITKTYVVHVTIFSKNNMFIILHFI